MDYKKICIDLFGTDDIDALKEIAEKVNKKNPRNAGRKKILSLDEQTELRALYAKGYTLEDLAKIYSTSRQVIGRYINTPMKDGCSLRVYFMRKHRPCTIIDVDFIKQRVYAENYTDNVWFKAFGNIEDPTWDDFEYFLRDRCFSENRLDVKDRLNKLGLNNYDPLAIIEKTKGKITDDNMWIKMRYKEQ